MLCFCYVENGLTSKLYFENEVYTLIDRCHATGIVLYTLKTSENKRLSNI